MLWRQFWANRENRTLVSNLEGWSNNHYTIFADLGRIRRVLSTETSSLFYVSRQSVPRHHCEPGGSRTLNPKNFRLKKACLPISPQVLIVAGQVGFEPTPSKLTVSSINHCATDHYICFEVSNGFEPLSLGYKARIISHYTKRPIKSVISLWWIIRNWTLILNPYYHHPCTVHHTQSDVSNHPYKGL